MGQPSTVVQRELTMSAVAPPDPSQSPSTAPKKKSNKKKKAGKGKPTEGTLKVPGNGKDAGSENGDAEGDEDSGQSTANTPRDVAFPESTKVQTNGHNHESKSNGHAVEPSSQPTIQAQRQTLGGSEEKQSETSDASLRFDAMSQEREALRVEVEQLRKALEDIQEKHTEEITTIKGQHAEELSSIESKHTTEVSTIKGQHEEEVSTIRAELEETESAKDHAETQYQSLLGRINTIKSSLGERLKADKQELAEAKEQIEELESQNESLQKNVKSLEGDVERLEQEANETSKELSSLRNRHNLSQQNWVSEREDLVQQTRQLRDEAEAAKEAMGDWEVLAMEERSMREGLAERDSQSQTLEGLQRALQDVQESRKRELREMVESYEEQLQALKKLVQDSDSRATEAEASKGALQTEVDRLIPFEKEIKEKNLLVGKLRHEA